MPDYWTEPNQFELVTQQILMRYYDECVSRRKLFAMLRRQAKYIHTYFKTLKRKPCNLYLPEFGFDLATLIVCDAVRPFLPSLMSTLQ